MVIRPPPNPTHPPTTTTTTSRVEQEHVTGRWALSIWSSHAINWNLGSLCQSTVMAKSTGPSSPSRMAGANHALPLVLCLCPAQQLPQVSHVPPSTLEPLSALAGLSVLRTLCSTVFILSPRPIPLSVFQHPAGLPIATCYSRPSPTLFYHNFCADAPCQSARRVTIIFQECQEYLHH